VVVAVADRSLERVLVRADLCGQRAARMESASWREIDRAWRLTLGLEPNQLPLAARQRAGPKCKGDELMRRAGRGRPARRFAPSTSLRPGRSGAAPPHRSARCGPDVDSREDAKYAGPPERSDLEANRSKPADERAPYGCEDVR
jgi:hypothetical protein